MVLMSQQRKTDYVNYGLFYRALLQKRPMIIVRKSDCILGGAQLIQMSLVSQHSEVHTGAHSSQHSRPSCTSFEKLDAQSVSSVQQSVSFAAHYTSE